MSDHENAIRNVVAAAGGRLIGKTRLQKTVYILKLAGLGPDFSFSYHYYGPYSEELSSSVRDAILDEIVQEEEDVAQWGGRYSIYYADNPDDLDPNFRELVRTACSSDSVTLELAATAAFLKLSGVENWWEETRRRKPQKATDERVASAKALWQKLCLVETPQALPAL